MNYLGILLIVRLVPRHSEIQVLLSLNKSNCVKGYQQNVMHDDLPPLLT